MDKYKLDKLRIFERVLIICLLYILFSGNVILTTKKFYQGLILQYKDNYSMIIKDKINKEELLTEKIKELQNENDSLIRIIRSTHYLRNLINEKAHIYIPKTFKDEYIEYIYKKCLKLNIPIDIIFRLIYKESYFNVNIKSCANAYGLMQITDDTYELFEIRTEKEKKCVYTNIDVGIQNLIYLHEYWLKEKKGYSKTYIWKLTLASYNAGLEKVKYYKGFPPFKETNDYIRFVLKYY
jgi:hypothetical protein